MSISCAAFEATVVPPGGADISHCARQTTCFQLTLCDNAPIAVSYNLLVIQIPMLVVNLRDDCLQFIPSNNYKQITAGRILIDSKRRFVNFVTSFRIDYLLLLHYVQNNILTSSICWNNEQDAT